MLIWACVSLDWCFGLPPRRASRFRAHARPRPGCGAPTHLYSAERAVGDTCVPRLRRVAPAQPGTTRMFPQRHVPTANSRRIGAALGDTGCNSAASTAIKICLCVIRRVTAPQTRSEMLPMCSSASSNASSNFFAPTCYGVSARQQLISTTASKPSFPVFSGAARAGSEDPMPLASH